LLQVGRLERLEVTRRNPVRTVEWRRHMSQQGAVYVFFESPMTLGVTAPALSPVGFAVFMALLGALGWLRWRRGA
jgi:hypothetical protein